MAAPTRGVHGCAEVARGPGLHGRADPAPTKYYDMSYVEEAHRALGWRDATG